MAARYMGAYVRGQVSAWRTDSAAAVRHFELARLHARMPLGSGLTRECGTCWIPLALAEAYVAGGPADRRGVSDCVLAAGGWSYGWAAPH